MFSDVMHTPSESVLFSYNFLQKISTCHTSMFSDVMHTPKVSQLVTPMFSDVMHTPSESVLFSYNFLQKYLNLSHLNVQ
ncbi:hypothetical protein J6590_003075 [Homalodisca vitripennis]|nr:hypothetical protein J6590_003075 [Homalodisca vitripennis]